MRLIIDTHIAIWSLTGDRRLPAGAYKLIEDRNVDVFVSAVSIWEIAIKHSLGRRSQDPVPFSGREARDELVASGYQLLAVNAAHAAAVDDLPRLHGDPFDRLLVAQALAEPMRLLTSDAIVARYSEMVILV